MNTVDIGQKYKRIVEYLWDPEPKNDDDIIEPVWCLGKEYKTSIPRDSEGAEAPESCNMPGMPFLSPMNQMSLSSRDTQAALSKPATPPHQLGIQRSKSREWPTSFLDDFESKFWFTYRSNFPAIPKSRDPDTPLALTLSVRLRSQFLDTHGFTADTGWGCMIRSGQSLLANALSILNLGRDWRRGSKIKEECELLSLFADNPQAPFSIHRFVDYGASACGKHPGEWFGPSATARCIE
ncbi:Cysteine protease atg4 [Coccidioides posadasii str. Silveira]|nr:Cysteine protease atg4 [Coccidioides posadasii str. Silveira]